MAQIGLRETIRRGLVTQEELGWRRSKKCDAGACVEVCIGHHEVMIHNSSDPTGVTIDVRSQVWQEFLTEIKLGLFDPTT